MKNRNITRLLSNLKYVRHLQINSIRVHLIISLFFKENSICINYQKEVKRSEIKIPRMTKRVSVHYLHDAIFKVTRLPDVPDKEAVYWSQTHIEAS